MPGRTRLACFHGVTAAGCVHEPVVVGPGVDPLARHLPCDSSQVCSAARFNRRFDLPDIIPRLVYVALRTPPMPERLLKLRSLRVIR